MQPISEFIAPLVERGYTPVARIRPRHAHEITGSPWSIGCETMDRDYVDFSHVGPHLGELGAKQVRLQAGWAKCDPQPGAPYHWEWLDTIIDNCVSQGVKPWLEASYGNPAYSGGGGIGLNEGLPHSPEALEGWDRWVRALAERYGDRVDTWEIWNEPEGCKKITPEAYTAFLVRTATILRAVQPRARIVGFATCDFSNGFGPWSGNNERPFPDQCIAALAAAGQTHLIDEISFHTYPHNPDDCLEGVEELGNVIKSYAPHVTLRQGETGAPSVSVPFMAHSGFFWNERKQAAWNLRTLLAHHAQGYPVNLFQLADMYYARKGGAIYEGINPKGLLCIRPDKSVAYRKPAYFVAQHVFSIFDDAWPLKPLSLLPRRFATHSSAYAWQRSCDSAPSLVAWWRADIAPEAMPNPQPILRYSLRLPAPLRDPVLVDFMSGVVFTPPAGAVDSKENPWAVVPCADTPLALAERSVLPLRDL